MQPYCADSCETRYAFLVADDAWLPCLKQEFQRQPPFPLLCPLLPLLPCHPWLVLLFLGSIWRDSLKLRFSVWFVDLVEPRNRPRLKTRAPSRGRLKFTEILGLPLPRRRTPHLTTPRMIGKDLKNEREISRKIEHVQSFARSRGPQENLSSTGEKWARELALREISLSERFISRWGEISRRT